MSEKTFIPVFDRLRGWLTTWEDFPAEDLEAITSAFKKGVLKQAVPAIVPRFEQRFAEFAGAKSGVSFCNGTAALYAALRATGVGPGDEVLVADYGFHGMAAAILATGATVVPCDIDGGSLCLDPAEIASARSPTTKAVMVHNPWGMPADWRQLREAVRETGLTLIADASHAHGALCEGTPLGAWADITCYSLGLRKLISGGELGCAVTSSPELRDKMFIQSHVNRVPQELSVHSWKGNAVGLKGRPHPLAVALALSQMERFPDKLERLRQTCRGLEKSFEQLGFGLQRTNWDVNRAYWRVVLRIDENRWPGVEARQIEDAFREAGVPVEPNHYRPLLQNQKIFEWPEYAGRLRRRSCPRAAKVAPQLITLPAPVQLPPELLEQSIDDFAVRLNRILNA